MKRALWGLLALAAVVLLGAFAWAWRHPIDLLVQASRRELATAGFEPTTLDGPGGALRVWRAGEGAPLILVHGAGDQAGSWAGVAPRFVDSWRVVAPDLAGHGDSAPADGPLSFDAVVESLERTVRSTNEASQPAVLVGNSMGAWASTLVSLRAPGAVERLVLVNGGPLRHEPEGLSLIPTDRDAARRLMAAMRDPASPQVPGAVLDDLVRRAPDGPIARMMADYGVLEAGLLDGRLADVTTPVDILWGRSDRFFGEAYAERLAAELPRARLTWIESCGHAPQVECPDRFAAALADVLAMAPPEAEPVAEAEPVLDAEPEGAE